MWHLIRLGSWPGAINLAWQQRAPFVCGTEEPAASIKNKPFI